MPILSQGDIFERLRTSDVDIAIIFGRISLNQMAPCWWRFQEREATLAHIRDPFSEVPNEPRKISSGQWLWFIPEQDNHGMSESNLQAVLDDAISWARTAGYRSVLTNGINNTDHGMDTLANQRSVDKRVQFLIRYCTDQENLFGIQIELIDLHRCFVRYQGRIFG